MYFNGLSYIKKDNLYKDMIDSMKADTQRFMQNFKDDSRFLSAWGHEYFCPTDGGRLIYDIEKPHSHVCKICGKSYNSFFLDGVYITFLRNEAAVTAIKSGIIYSITKEKEYIDVIKKIIGFYAVNYESFPLHAKRKLSENPSEDVGGCGKIMPQGLNEAIIMIRFINALELVKEDLPKQFLLEIKNKMFSKAVELFIPQKQHIHNIPCWLNSAIGVIGFFFGEEKWIEEAQTNQFNIYDQIQNGVTEAGFWYEGSIHYNFFALEGILNFLIFSQLYQGSVNKKAAEVVLKMLNSAYEYAFDNDIFPNPSDGWPNISMKTYSYIYYMGYKALGERVLPYIKHIEDNTLARTKIPLSEPYYFKNKIPLERLLFLPEIKANNSEFVKKRKSQQFEASNCGIIRNDIFNVFLKYGHQTKSHAHPDKMNIEITINGNVHVKDLSNSGYFSDMCNNWHRKNEAHNTVMVNCKACDIERSGKLISYNEKFMKASCEPYKDTVFTRAISLDGNCLNDEFIVHVDTKSKIDYFYHFENDVSVNAELLENDTFCEYPYIFHVNRVVTKEKNLIISTSDADTVFDLQGNEEIYLAKTYNNPANTFRNTLIIRVISDKAEFKNTVKAKNL